MTAATQAARRVRKFLDERSAAWAGDPPPAISMIDRDGGRRPAVQLTTADLETLLAERNRT